MHVTRPRSLVKGEQRLSARNLTVTLAESVKHLKSGIVRVGYMAKVPARE
jgi:hypothetical protein